MGHFGGKIVDSNRGTNCRGCHLGSGSGFSDGAGAGFREVKRALKIFLSLPRNANEDRWGSSVTYLRTHRTPRYLDMTLNESPPTFNRGPLLPLTNDQPTYPSRYRWGRGGSVVRSGTDDYFTTTRNLNV